MTRNRLLKKQSIKRKGPGRLSTAWKVFGLMGSWCFRGACVVIVLVMISLFFVSVYGYMLTSPYIRLHQVVFEGVDGELKKELLAMSKLDFDLSLLAINLRDVKRRLEKHPWIRTVELEKRFPHTLIVRAEKERAWALVVEEKLHYMNRWGEVFKEIEAGDPLDYPLITGITLGAGDAEEKLFRAVRVLSHFESGDGRWSLKDLSEVHVKDNGNLALYFCSLPLAVQVPELDLDRRMNDLGKVVEHLDRAGQISMVNAIYMDCQDGAVVSFKRS